MTGRLAGPDIWPLVEDDVFDAPCRLCGADLLPSFARCSLTGRRAGPEMLPLPVNSFDVGDCTFLFGGPLAGMRKGLQGQPLLIGSFAFSTCSVSWW